MIHLITFCADHGTVESVDETTARIMRDVARDCLKDGRQNPRAHAQWHADEMTACFRCCDRVSVRPNPVPVAHPCCGVALVDYCQC